MNVNTWICTCATDSDLESGFSEATVILIAFSVKTFVLRPKDDIFVVARSDTDVQIVRHMPLSFFP